MVADLGAVPNLAWLTTIPASCSSGKAVRAAAPRTPGQRVPSAERHLAASGQNGTRHVPGLVSAQGRRMDADSQWLRHRHNTHTHKPIHKTHTRRTHMGTHCVQHIAHTPSHPLRHRLAPAVARHQRLHRQQPRPLLALQ